MHMLALTAPGGLDMFIFEIGTLAYQELQRRSTWRHAKGERFGARSAMQFLGPGDDTISLPGVLYPGQIGDYSSLEKLRDLADAGDAYLLVTGYGEVLGEYVITGLDVTQSYFLQDGVPRKVDFTISLDRAPDTENPAQAGMPAATPVTI